MRPQSSRTHRSHSRGLKDFNYMFKVGGVRFLVIHSLEVSTLRPKGSSEYAEAEAYLQAHSDRKLQKYNGMLSEAGKRWLDELPREKTPTGAAARGNP